MEKNKKPYSAEIMATKPAAEVIDVVALGKKGKPSKQSSLKATMPTPMKQDITSLFSMTPEALGSIVRRWRDSAGHRTIGRAKAKLLKADPSPILVHYILNGATAGYNDAGMGGIDSRILFSELAKCINDRALSAAINECRLNLITPGFYESMGDSEEGKLSAMWVLHPVFGERVMEALPHSPLNAINSSAVRRDAMRAMMKRDPNHLIAAVIAGNVSKQALVDLKSWTNNSHLSRNNHDTEWTKIALVRAAIWPEDMLKQLMRDPRVPFECVFDDSRAYRGEETVLHWWPTLTDNSKAVYEDAINGVQIHYFELMLVTAMGAIIDRYKDVPAKGAFIIDSTLSKLPHVKDTYFNLHTWRNVLTLAYRHEHMELIVQHLAGRWKGFAQATLTDDTVDWFVDTLPSMRGRMPDIINRPGKPKRLGKTTRLCVMLRTIYDAADCEVEEKGLRASMKLRKWVNHGTVTDMKITSMEAAKKFFLPKAISDNLVTDYMVSLADSLSTVTIEAARRQLLTIDADVLRGLLVHGNNDLVLYLYYLNPVLVWAVEYPRTFTGRSKPTRDKIRKMLPAWLLGVTDSLISWTML